MPKEEPQLATAGVPQAVLKVMENTVEQFEALSSRLKQIEDRSLATPTVAKIDAAAVSKAVNNSPITFAQAMKNFQPVSLLLTTTSRQAFEAQIEMGMKNRLSHSVKERQQWPWHAPLPTPSITPKLITMRRDQLAKRYITAPENESYSDPNRFLDLHGQTVYTWGNQLEQERLFRTHVRPHFVPPLQLLPDQSGRIDFVNSHAHGWYDINNNVHLSPPDAPDGVDEAGPFWVYEYGGAYRAARQLPDALATSNAKPLWIDRSTLRYSSIPQTVNTDIPVLVV